MTEGKVVKVSFSYGLRCPKSVFYESGCANLPHRGVATSNVEAWSVITASASAFSFCFHITGSNTESVGGRRREVMSGRKGGGVGRGAVVIGRK